MLRQLDELLDRYESLKRASRRTWDRITLGSVPLSEIRSKVQTRLGSISAFLSSLAGGASGRIARKIDDLAADLCKGMRQPAVLRGFEEYDADIWQVHKRQLLGEGITPRDIEMNKETQKWIY